MERRTIHKEIVESVRRQMLTGMLASGDPLPTVREMAENWGCAPGTVQAAYRELAEQGLIVCRPGIGTRVKVDMSQAAIGDDTPMRRAMLVNRTEAFLLDAMTAGYTRAEVEFALHSAMDRWFSVQGSPVLALERTLRFVGSHDPAVSYISAHFSEIDLKTAMSVKFTGSLGGLMALAEGQADIAGCHLWDPEAKEYNLPYVKRLLPDRKIALIRLASRKLGLVTAAGNPKRIKGLGDLTRKDVRYVNRAPGTGTRVWLDAQLAELGIPSAEIAGYDVEVTSHGDVAQAVAQGRADAGLAIETVAYNYGLGFAALVWESYDLVLTSEIWELPAVQGLIRWLKLPGTKFTIEQMKGYYVKDTGVVVKIRT
jgi:molybdate-binding protein/DNA-binding transcriptional regulator YhcF (GntR family)